MAKRQGIRIIKVRERKTVVQDQSPVPVWEQQVTKDRSRQMAAIISSWVREIQGRPVVGGKRAFDRLLETPVTPF